MCIHACLWQRLQGNISFIASIPWLQTLSPGIALVLKVLV